MRRLVVWLKASARAVATRQGAGVAGACLASAVLLRLSFPVPGWWPLAWVALVPWLVVLRTASGRGALWGSVLFGLVASGLGLSWQYVVTILGGLGLTIYLAAYGVLFACLLRATMRRFRLPLVAAAPVLWVAVEYLRSFALTGLPWYYVGHSQVPWRPLVQVADLQGAYALSFLVLAGNALVAEVWLAWRARSWAWARLIGSALFVLVLVVGALGYGTWRLPRVRSRPGPLVGLVQANIPQEIKNRQRTDHIFLKHWETTQELRGAARGRELDLIVWPESMVQLPLNRSGVEAVDVFRKALINIARMLDVPLLVGAYAEVGADNVLRAEAAGTVDAVTDQAIVVGDRSYPLPTAVDPPTGERPRRRVLVEPGEAVEEGETLAIVESIVHNSAFLVRPDRGFVPADRYDKNHLVPFGEYVPLQGLLFFLGQVVPYGKGFTGSDRQNLMEVAGTRFGVLICFEDVFPYLVQDYVVREGGGADFLINISNDGWFQGTHELDQHLAMCRLRAIEFRTGIVRCCNTGISAIIDPRGDLQTVIEDATGDRKEVAGVAVGRVRLRDEITAYARHGDVLGKACLAAAVLILLDALIACLRARLRRRRCKDGVCEV